ncbi:MAG: glucokinase [Acetobacteraceae bacterium]|jgi:glucokinase|nr:glucokinase [Acetobacteraceae bacterium]MEA2772166.1 glucokinase [Acetobacteraceae bacterium]
MLIAGDIGGTKTLLALYVPESGARKPIAQAEFHSANYHSLEDIVRAFIEQTNRPVEAACFDVAGPVINGRAHLTNLPWVLDEGMMEQTLGLKRVMLLNDLKAVAYAVPHLLPEDVHTINEGRADPHGPMAVIAPGTGLGEAFSIWNGSTYVACSSEGGHADFAPTDETQAALRHYLSDRYGHVAYERVCSGSGLPNIYDFLRDSKFAPEPAALAAILAQAADRTPIIFEAALQDPADALCAATLDLFVSILGAEAGNLALKVLATGGVYLGGGIPPRILSRLDDGRLMRAFVSKGRFADLLAKVPVKVITTQAALLGAALYGLDQIGTPR